MELVYGSMTGLAERHQVLGVVAFVGQVLIRLVVQVVSGAPWSLAAGTLPGLEGGHVPALGVLPLLGVHVEGVEGLKQSASHRRLLRMKTHYCVIGLRFIRGLTPEDYRKLTLVPRESYGSPLAFP